MNSWTTGPTSSNCAGWREQSPSIKWETRCCHVTSLTNCCGTLQQRVSHLCFGKAQQVSARCQRNRRQDSPQRFVAIIARKQLVGQDPSRARVATTHVKDQNDVQTERQGRSVNFHWHSKHSKIEDQSINWEWLPNQAEQNTALWRFQSYTMWDPRRVIHHQNVPGEHTRPQKRWKPSHNAEWSVPHVVICGHM